MTRVEIKRNDNDEIIGFRVEGHAEYSEHGSDVVCAGVSALVINCINSIEKFTDSHFDLKTEENQGLIDFQLTGTKISPDTNLLLLSLILGITKIGETYGKEYVTITNNKGGARP